MINEEYIDLITGQLQNSLTAEEKQKFDELVRAGKIDLAGVRKMEELYQHMGSISVPEPDPVLGQNFHAMLQQEVQKQQQKELQKEQMKQEISPVRQLINRAAELLQQIGTTLSARWMDMRRFEHRRLALTAAVFMIGLFLGNFFSTRSYQHEQINQLTAEVHDLREMMMINLLDNTSATERLRAVSISMEIQPVQNRVIEALIHTLNHDSNVNVRLAAVDALVYHASNPLVRHELVNSITRQESPIVQIALADAMIALQEPRAVREFEKLMERNEVYEPVREKLEKTITALI